MTQERLSALTSAVRTSTGVTPHCEQLHADGALAGWLYHYIAKSLLAHTCGSPAFAVAAQAGPALSELSHECMVMSTRSCTIIRISFHGKASAASLPDARRDQTGRFAGGKQYARLHLHVFPSARDVAGCLLAAATCNGLAHHNLMLHYHVVAY
jgi:hypothetical protein